MVYQYGILVYGISMVLWYTMVYQYGILWYTSMVYQYGILWYTSMVYYGISMIYQYGILWYKYCILWYTMLYYQYGRSTLIILRTLIIYWYFIFQEPENDPRPCCYLWIARGQTGNEEIDDSPTTITLYQLVFGRKENLPGYGRVLKVKARM